MGGLGLSQTCRRVSGVVFRACGVLWYVRQEVLAVRRPGLQHAVIFGRETLRLRDVQ